MMSNFLCTFTSDDMTPTPQIIIMLALLVAVIGPVVVFACGKTDKT